MDAVVPSNSVRTGHLRSAMKCLQPVRSSVDQWSRSLDRLLCVALNLFDVYKWKVVDSMVPKEWEHAYRSHRLAKKRYNIVERRESSDAEADSQNALSYVYERLPAQDCIRLLLLKPAGLDTPIECTLKAYSLADCPAYTALSYTWGSPKGECSILCNGRKLPVTRNLKHALRKLRCQTTELLFWIDAVCIDQADEDERGEQVQLMKQIYAGARAVTIWLGAESDDSAIAFELIRRVGAVSPEPRPGSTAEAMDSQALARKILPCQGSPEWRALDHLCRRPWFRRVWIIQELTLAKEARVVCGAESATWEELETTARFVQEHSIPVDHTGNVTNLSSYRDQYQHGRPLTLLSLLFHTTRREATDPRDKVYSLLGICSDVGAEDIKPDYRKPAAEVFRATAAMYLRRGVVNVLTGLADPRWRLTPGLPSWVPDWACDPRAWQLGFAGDYMAGGRLEPQIRLSTDAEAVVASGVVADTVRLTGPRMAWGNPDVIPGVGINETAVHAALVELRHQRLQQWHRVARLLDTYPTGETVAEAFQRTIAADRGPWTGRPDLLGEKPLGALYEGLLRAHFYPEWTSADDEVWAEQRSSSLEEGRARTRADAIAYAYAFRWASQERRFFITHKGFMGLGPRSTEPGDAVCVLAGATTPFVLRRCRRDPSYAVKGECYMHGIMHGESFASGDRARDIRLR